MKYTATPRFLKIIDIHQAAGIGHGELTETVPMPVPERIEIEVESETGYCAMYRYTATGEFCGDTWHESLDAAFQQANFEYGLSPRDFLMSEKSDPAHDPGGALPQC